MASQTSTSAPPPPPNSPSDWSKTVQGNYFTNIQRLCQWIGGTAPVQPGISPASNFQPVSPGSLGDGADPPTIYVLAHGWAPGYRAAVNAQSGNLLWWGADASITVKGVRVWASDWAWMPVKQLLQINATGFLQSIVAMDPDAIVLAYSWIDDSATDTLSFTTMDEVYRSEAYTHLNGLRLADALETAIAPSFWNQPSGLLRLIGHSHGSKVATVAALTLQKNGYRVAHLTTLDAPECNSTLEHNGSNLLGFYLEQIQIADPSYDHAAGAFIDNYVSYFGVNYAGTTNLNNIVEAMLYPSKLYGWDDVGGQHTYAAAWYGGAAAGAASHGAPPLGFAWPPPPSKYLPALNQNWRNGITESAQWRLSSGPPSYDTYSYSTQPLTVTTVSTHGNVQGDPSTRLLFLPTNGAYSIFHGSYDNWLLNGSYGMAFDLLWTAPQAGDYLVVAMESPEKRELEVLLVLDGQSNPAGNTSIAINSDVRDLGGPVRLLIYFLAAQPNSISQVSISNFRLVYVTSASGYLRARRLARLEEMARKQSLAPPNTLVPAPPETTPSLDC
jgi:hypothetical protein